MTARRQKRARAKLEHFLGIFLFSLINILKIGQNNAQWSKIWDSQIGPKILHFPKVEHFFCLIFCHALSYTVKFYANLSIKSRVIMILVTRNLLLRGFLANYSAKHILYLIPKIWTKIRHKIINWCMIFKPH